MNFECHSLENNFAGPYLQVVMLRCQNDDCMKEHAFAVGINGYMNNNTVNLYPRIHCKYFPEYVPAAIRSDYEEACAVVKDSPKAAATLARRCLQGMIHDFWNIHEKNLNAEITKLKSQIPANQWKAIDAVRSLGNIGAHMEHDVNLIIDVDLGEAEKLLRLIEHLIEKWYVDRYQTERLYTELEAISQKKNSQRNSK